MKQLQEDLKSGQFRPFYLLYGAEDYLLKQYKHRLKDGLVSGEDTMNYAYFEGKGIVPETVIDLAETMPFFAERRVILIENSGWLKKTPEKLADYLPDTPEFTCFIFVEREVDKRSKLFKLIQKKGRAVEMNRQTEATLTKWVLGILKREQKQISQPALELFLSRTGLEMEQISVELEKLLSYCMNRDAVTEADILAITSAQTPDQIFQMMDAISYRQPTKAIDLYCDLLSRREPPLRILSMLVRQFHILLKVKLLIRDGYSGQALAQKAGYPSFAVRKAQSQVGRFRSRELLEALRLCATTEQEIKSGRINDRIGVELLILRAASPSTTPRT